MVLVEYYGCNLRYSVLSVMVNSMNKKRNGKSFFLLMAVLFNIHLANGQGTDDFETELSQLKTN